MNVGAPDELTVTPVVATEDTAATVDVETVLVTVRHTGGVNVGIVAEEEVT